MSFCASHCLRVWLTPESDLSDQHNCFLFLKLVVRNSETSLFVLASATIFSVAAISSRNCQARHFQVFCGWIMFIQSLRQPPQKSVFWLVLALQSFKSLQISDFAGGMCMKLLVKHVNYMLSCGIWRFPVTSGYPSISPTRHFLWIFH